MSTFYKKIQNHINLNKEFKIILLLLLFLIIPKWIIPFLNGESDWLINTIIISSDTQYFPMIISLSEFEFAPSYLDFYQNNNLISVPFYSLFFHAVMFSLLGIKSFFILEIIFKLFFLFFFYKLLNLISNDKKFSIFFILFIFLIYILSSFFLKYTAVWNLNISLDGFLGLRVPRPLATDIFVIIAYSCILNLKNQNIFNQDKNFYLFSFVIAFFLNSFFFYFIHFFLLFIFYFFIEKKINLNLFIIKKYKTILVCLFFFLIISTPFLLQFFFGENENRLRLGLVNLSLDTKIAILKYFVYSLFRIKALIFIALCIFSYILLNFITNNNEIKKNINIFFKSFLISLISPIIFFIFTNKIIGIFHFYTLIVFNGFFYIILVLSYSIYLVQKKIFINKNNVLNTTILVIFLLLNIILSKKNFTQNSEKYLIYNDVQKFITEHKIQDSNVRLFTNDNVISHIWLLNKNKFLVISDGAMNSLKDHQIEFNLISNLKFFGLKKNDVENLLEVNNDSIRNPFFLFLYNYKFQANSLFTFTDLKNYETTSIDIITKTSPFRMSSQIVPSLYKKKIIKNFDKVILNKNVIADIVIINKKIFKKFDIKNNFYIKKKDLNNISYYMKKNIK